MLRATRRVAPTTPFVRLSKEALSKRGSIVPRESTHSGFERTRCLFARCADLSAKGEIMSLKRWLFAVSAMAFGVGAYAQDAKNLVNNPGFEQGLAGWSSWVEDANAGVQKDVDKNEQVEGRQSLVLDIFRAGGGGG